MGPSLPPYSPEVLITANLFPHDNRTNCGCWCSIGRRARISGHGFAKPHRSRRIPYEKNKAKDQRPDMSTPVVFSPVTPLHTFKRNEQFLNLWHARMTDSCSARIHRVRQTILLRRAPETRQNTVIEVHLAGEPCNTEHSGSNRKF